MLSASPSAALPPAESAVAVVVSGAVSAVAPAMPAPDRTSAPSAATAAAERGRMSVFIPFSPLAVTGPRRHPTHVPVAERIAGIPNRSSSAELGERSALSPAWADGAGARLRCRRHGAEHDQRQRGRTEEDDHAAEVVAARVVPQRGSEDAACDAEGDDGDAGDLRHRRLGQRSAAHPAGLPGSTAGGISPAWRAWAARLGPLAGDRPRAMAIVADGLCPPSA